MRAEVEQYARGNSLLHRWDARWKAVSIFVFILAAATLNHAWMALIALLVSYLLLLASSLPLSLLLRRLGSVHLLLIPCFIILPFTAQGTPVDWLGITFSMEGIRMATLFYLRAVAVIAASIALLYTTPMQKLLHAAERLYAPHALVQITLITYRYLFSLTWELSNVRKALATRGFENRTSLACYKTLANVIGSSLIRSLERTDRIYNAMRCRGYGGRMKTLYHFSTDGKDIMLSTVLLAVSIALAGYDWLK